FDQAEKMIARALEVNPHHAGAYEMRGSLWLYDGNYRKAIEDFQKSLEEGPASLSARGQLAACRFLLTEKEEVAKEEEAARAVNPKCARFYHTIAEALEHRFRYVDAVAMCDKALALDEGYWPAYMTLGINCLRTGDNLRGRKYLEKSWENDKYNVWVF